MIISNNPVPIFLNMDMSYDPQGGELPFLDFYRYQEQYQRL